MAEGVKLPTAGPLPGGHHDCTGCTLRQDDWKTGPMLTVFVFLSFIVYSTWAAFQGEHYFVHNYLSPFYSPCAFTDAARAGSVPVAHAWFGAKPSWYPAFLPFSPAFFILIFPGAFRFTCYYYRKAYYRSFWANPVGCAVVPFRKGLYKGETSLLLFQNLHRYALYFAIIFIGILYHDAYRGFFSPSGKLGIGVGSIVLTLNATFLACYTFGCHSFRHLIGGRLNWFSESPVGHGFWKGATFLNERHMQFAWLSLIWVGLTDAYVRCVSMGLIHDLNTWG
ncbi:MAG: succinate dehydrogenase [Planctomycetota bacterium]